MNALQYNLSSMHNHDAERAILCSCLINGAVIAKIINVLAPRAFSDGRNRLIYTAMTELFWQGVDIDVITVSDRLTTNRVLEQAGGELYLAQLSTHQATSANVLSYVKIVREYWIRRETSVLCSGLIGKLTALGINEVVQEVILEHLTNLSNAVTLCEDNQVKVLQEYYNSVLLEYELAAQDPNKIISWDIGFPALDSLWDGLKPGALMIVVAPSGMGKSDYMMNCALNLAKQVPVAINSLEMMAHSVVTRMVAMKNEINSRAIRHGLIQLTPEFHSKGFDCLPIIIDDKRGLTAYDIRAKLTVLTARYGIKVCCIDHKDIIRFHTKNKSDVDNWRAIPQEFKRIAGDLQIAIILLAQPTLAGLRKGKIIGADIRNGGYEDADIIVSLYRENYQKPYIETEDLVVTAWKVREGTPGQAILKYRPHSGKMYQDFGVTATELPYDKSKDDDFDVDLF